MVIYIKEGAAAPGEKPFRMLLPLPNLFCSPALMGLLTPLANRILRQKGSSLQLTAAQLRQLARALRRWRRTAPDTTLVEVDSADGTQVRIKL